MSWCIHVASDFFFQNVSGVACIFASDYYNYLNTVSKLNIWRLFWYIRRPGGISKDDVWFRRWQRMGCIMPSHLTNAYSDASTSGISLKKQVIVFNTIPFAMTTEDWSGYSFLLTREVNVDPWFASYFRWNFFLCNILKHLWRGNEPGWSQLCFFLSL